VPQFADRQRDPRSDDIQIRYDSGAAQTAVHNDRLVLRVPAARAGRASQPDGAVSAAPGRSCSGRGSCGVPSAASPMSSSVNCSRSRSHTGTGSSRRLGAGIQTRQRTGSSQAQTRRSRLTRQQPPLHAGCQDKPISRRNARWMKYAAASAARRPATPSLNSRKADLALLAADATTSRWRPNLGLRTFLVSPARMRRERDALAVPLGEAPSDRGGRQRPPRPGCLIPCRPVSPVSPPGGTQHRSYYMSYYSARHAKGPLPAGKGP
jgi:hypothetical protein